ncbi:MAG: hypothetical protein GY697_19605 [Desulfobacterales bacterium]|nr:hypothetical protein [Desulfobacterales bacterium]
MVNRKLPAGRRSTSLKASLMIFSRTHRQCPCCGRKPRFLPTTVGICRHCSRVMIRAAII